MQTVQLADDRRQVWALSRQAVDVRAAIVSDVDGESLDAKLRRTERALLVVRPCIHCYAVPEVIARDAGGLPLATGWTHDPDCPLHVPDWP